MDEGVGEFVNVKLESRDLQSKEDFLTEALLQNTAAKNCIFWDATAI